MSRQRRLKVLLHLSKPRRRGVRVVVRGIRVAGEHLASSIDGLGQGVVDGLSHGCVGLGLNSTGLAAVATCPAAGCLAAHTGGA